MPIIVNNLSTWMTLVNGNQRIRDICLPGSHDAGLYMTTFRKLCGNSSVITQDLSILGQLQAGVRMFDMRFFEYSRNDIRIGHFAELRSGRADFGAYGPRIDTILGDVATFMGGDGAGETVLLRFTHIKTGITRGVVDKVVEHLDAYLYKVGVATNIAEVRLNNARGKVIALFDHGKFNGLRNQANGIHTISKGMDSAGDLKSCQGFSDEKHFTPMYNKQCANMANHAEHLADAPAHLAQLYWTLTGGNIKQNTERKMRKHSAMANLLPLIRTYGPNVVFYDFCNAGYSTAIIEAGN